MSPGHRAKFEESANRLASAMTPGGAIVSAAVSSPKAEPLPPSDHTKRSREFEHLRQTVEDLRGLVYRLMEGAAKDHQAIERQRAENDATRSSLTKLGYVQNTLRQMIPTINLDDEGGGGVDVYTVDRVGGSAGDKDTACSFTYDVYTYGDTPGDDTPLDTAVGLTGHGQRILNAVWSAGTIGIGFFNADGDVVLIWVDETVDQNNCEPPE